MGGGFKHEFYFPFHIWDVIFPIDELIFFKMVKTTNQTFINHKSEFQASYIYIYIYNSGNHIHKSVKYFAPFNDHPMAVCFSILWGDPVDQPSPNLWWWPVICYSLLLKMAIEIMDLPIENGGSFQFVFCSLPEGSRGYFNSFHSC